jgi:hypothetical protein
MKPLEGTVGKRTIVTAVPASSAPQKTIVILGVERGGTSMVAGMIRALGVDLGERAGRNHEDPKFLTDDQDKLSAQINDYNSRKSVWGFKVPKASLMLDFYDKHLRNPHYVLVFRNVEATVDSWCSRGTNDPIQSALHAMKYYDAVLKYLNGTKRPLVFANYERACDNPEGFALDLATFIGVQADESMIKRAASIVTGDGGGYLDLPEYYFHIEALESEEWPPTAIEHHLSDDSEKHLLFSSKKVGDRVIISPKGEFFPKDFYVGFDLQSQDNEFITEQGLRIYMGFLGEFFPGHAFRPPITNGRNLIKISTNGNVRKIALGALRPGFTFGFDNLSCFASSDDSASNSYQVIQPLINRSVPLPKRFLRKLRLILRKSDSFMK